jgi:magnesium-protoporphyrin O-methyltransferase
MLGAAGARPLPPRPTLLDIGGGVGVIHHVLLERGFSNAMQVDASPAYLEAAAEEAGRLGHAGRVDFRLAEFPAEAGEVPAADLVTLDRVVCCYADYQSMLRAAGERARHVLALSYPRPRRLAHWSVAAGNLVRRLRGQAFRVFVHSPARMGAVLEATGLRRVWAGGTWIWAVEVFERPA